MSTRMDSAREVARLHRSDTRASTARPLIAHIIFSFDVGGLENGLVNLINHMPGRYRHVVICLSHFTDFRERIRRPGVRVLALHKRPGKDFGMYVRLWRLLKRLRPDIVHTRNYGALDSVLVAALAGVPIRVHGEHGWDMTDLHGGSIKYRLLRRSLGPLIQRHVTVSRDLGDWLKEQVRIPAARVSPICNGVDTEAFCPMEDGAPDWREEAGADFGRDKFIIGTIGRMDAVKDQATLVRGFAQLLRDEPALRERARLVVIGDGPDRDQVLELIRREDLTQVSWLPGRRDDISRLLCGMDLFVLPSLNEGISNTILEAMACGRAVVATRVGGNPELIVDGETGTLVPPSNPVALARAMAPYALDPAWAQRIGRAGRARAERQFSLHAMVGAYTRLYDNLLGAQ
ncbi:MAG TPA: TIGR03088 family PEP-CTERM/XrtA system glycosyltransferase [Gammaproteobacteria bacterium]|nr:TIGR03088 family PEP-CTERM/XrtA system glycosyltransferase [Gammaproteobacteria bacterium]